MTLLQALMNQVCLALHSPALLAEKFRHEGKVYTICFVRDDDDGRVGFYAYEGPREVACLELKPCLADQIVDRSLPIAARADTYR